VKTRALLALFAAALVGSAGCGKIIPKLADAGAHPDAVERTDAPPAREDAREDAHHEDARHEDAHHEDARHEDAHHEDVRVSRDATRPRDAGSDTILTGGACGSDKDCVLYPAGTGGCCGACLPKSQPAPSKVECLLPCLTPIQSCTCASAMCTASTTLL
jgi:hypothetical protein